MKKTYLLGLVILLLLASAIPVLAKNNQSNRVGNGQTADVGTADETPIVQNRGQGQLKEKSLDKEKTFSPNPNSSKNQNSENAKLPFYLQGTITSIDTSAGTITVSLVHGNAQVKMYIGSELTMNISEGIQVIQVTQGDEDGDMEEDNDGDMDDDDDGDMEDDDERDMDDDDDGAMDDDDGEMNDAVDLITVSDDDDMDSMKEVITIDQLAVGQKVAIHGIAANELFTATTITVYIRLDGGEWMDD